MKISYKQLKQLILEQVSSVLLEQAAAAGAIAPGARRTTRARPGAPGTEANPIEGPEIRVTGRVPAPAPAPAPAPSAVGTGGAVGARGTARYENLVQQMMTLRNNMAPSSNQVLATLQQIRTITAQPNYDAAAQQQVTQLIARGRRAADVLNRQIENIRNHMDSVRAAAAATGLGGRAMGARADAASFTSPTSATARGLGDLASTAMQGAAHRPGVIPSESTITVTPQQIENLTSMSRVLDALQREIARVKQTMSYMLASVADQNRITRLNPHLNWRQICSAFVADPLFNNIRPAATSVGASGSSGQTLSIPIARENRRRKGNAL